MNHAFTIIIPSSDRIKILSDLLKSISKLTYSEDLYEVLVVNNGCENLEQTILDFQKSNPNINISLLVEPKLGPSFARNKGIRYAKCPYIVCIDDDVIPPKNFLSKCSEIIRKHPDVAIVGGKIVAVSNNHKRLKYFLKILGEDSWVFSQTNRKEKKLTHLKFPDDLISANILINRNVVKGKVFNEKFGRRYKNKYIWAEDTELSLRLLYKGKQVIYDPTIISSHLIGEEKLNPRYILGRFLRAGLEHRLLDEEFKDYKFKLYRFDLRLFLRILKTAIIHPTTGNFLRVVREILFFIGYYFKFVFVATVS